MVRAKFQCQRIEESRYAGGKQSKIILTAVTPYNSEDTVDNKKFWEASPSGELVINVANERAVEYFKPGTAYYIDFTEAPAPEPAPAAQ